MDQGDTILFLFDPKYKTYIKNTNIFKKRSFFSYNPPLVWIIKLFHVFVYDYNILFNTFAKQVGRQL